MHESQMLPPEPHHLQQRVAELEARVRELSAARSVARTTVDDGELRLIGARAALRMLDEMGVTFLYAGPDNQGRCMFRLAREGGQPMMTTGFAGARQFWALQDLQSQILVSDDALSGFGLARPYLSAAVAAGRYTDWLATQSATFDPVHKVMITRQHPRIRLGVRYTGDVAVDVTGEIRVSIPDTGQILDTWPVVYAQGLRRIGPIALTPPPSTPLRHMEQYEVWVEARKTGGAADGVIRCDITYVEGVQS